MKDQLISFETAKLAKEKGFKENCYYVYDKEGNIEGVEYIDDLMFTIEHIQAAQENDYNMYLASTQSLLQRWLREIYKIAVEVWSDRTFKWFYSIGTTGSYHTGLFKGGSYEEALEAGLLEALKLIK